jgi:hypothetical protein
VGRAAERLNETGQIPQRSFSMTSPGIRGTLDQARGAMKELEGRIQMMRGHLKVLQGRARRARGAARLELTHLEREAARQVARADKVLEEFRRRLGEALATARRRLDVVIRSVEPSLERSLKRARELGSTARRLPRTLRAGVRAKRQALTRKR